MAQGEDQLVSSVSLSHYSLVRQHGRAASPEADRDGDGPSCSVRAARNPEAYVRRNFQSMARCTRRDEGSNGFK